MGMIKREFTAIYKKTGRWISAWIEEVPGVNTQGRTKKEARDNLKEALTVVIEANRQISGVDRGTYVREPISVVVPA